MSKKNDFVSICIDLAMRGVGSHSCGSELPAEYEIPKKYKTPLSLLSNLIYNKNIRCGLITEQRGIGDTTS